MFSQEEYPYYNSREGFDWDKIVNLIYTKKGQELAKKSLAQRRKEQTINRRLKLCFLSKSNSTATTSHTL